MKTIQIGILKENVDGTKPYMACAFIDSYGDVLLKVLTLDDIAGDNKLMLDNYFAPCGICGLPVVDSSIVPDTQGMCDHCYKAGPADQYVIKAHALFGHIPGANIPELMDQHERQSAMLNMALTQTLPEDVMTQTMIGIEESIIKVKINTGLTKDERIAIALETGEQAFWDVIARSFPEAESGDYLMEDIHVTLEPNVRHWVELNADHKIKDIPSYRGDKLDLDELHLHYPETWHLMHMGGGCMVAITDNVAVNMKHYYLAVSGECVCIYEDTFNQDNFMQEHTTDWTFGDNPTVLMNQIDEFMGGTGYWDTGKLFDDIQTLAKCDKVT